MRHATRGTDQLLGFGFVQSTGTARQAFGVVRLVLMGVLFLINKMSSKQFDGVAKNLLEERGEEFHLD